MSKESIFLKPFDSTLVCEGKEGEVKLPSILLVHGKAASCLLATFPDYFWAPPPNQVNLSSFRPVCLVQRPPSKEE